MTAHTTQQPLPDDPDLQRVGLQLADGQAVQVSAQHRRDVRDEVSGHTEIITEQDIEHKPQTVYALGILLSAQRWSRATDLKLGILTDGRDRQQARTAEDTSGSRGAREQSLSAVPSQRGQHQGAAPLHQVYAGHPRRGSGTYPPGHAGSVRSRLALLQATRSRKTSP